MLHRRPIVAPVNSFVNSIFTIFCVIYQYTPPHVVFCVVFMVLRVVAQGARFALSAPMSHLSALYTPLFALQLF